MLGLGTLANYLVLNAHWVDDLVKAMQTVVVIEAFWVLRLWLPGLFIGTRKLRMELAKAKQLGIVQDPNLNPWAWLAVYTALMIIKITTFTGFGGLVLREWFAGDPGVPVTSGTILWRIWILIGHMTASTLLISAAYNQRFWYTFLIWTAISAVIILTLSGTGIPPWSGAGWIPNWMYEL